MMENHIQTISLLYSLQVMHPQLYAWDTQFTFPIHSVLPDIYARIPLTDVALFNTHAYKTPVCLVLYEKIKL